MTMMNSVVDLHVPGEYSTIQAACDMAASLNIGSSGLVRSIVADGVRNERNITPRVVNWQRFQIIGNESNPDACVINLDTSDNSSGFVAVDGYGIGYLNGFTINGYNGWVSDTDEKAAAEIALAEQQRAALLAVANKYRVLLSRINAETTEQIDWPEKPV